jgi:hypothetical protein
MKASELEIPSQPPTNEERREAKKIRFNYMVYILVCEYNMAE